MRHKVNVATLHEFMRSLARHAESRTRVYLVGGATAVLEGWRQATIDIDIELKPESHSLLREIQDLKERLQVNVEFASPSQFVPEVPGWEGRSKYVGQEGDITYYHYDFYAQALAKIERAHLRDNDDVAEMLRRGLIEPKKLLELLNRIEPELFRYPAVDARSFRTRVERLVASNEQGAQPKNNRHLPS